jgi:hypothetical protein
MKISDKEYPLENVDGEFTGGVYTIQFKLQELIEAITKSTNKVIQLAQLWPTFCVNRYEVIGNKVYMQWQRRITDSERTQIKEIQKKNRLKWKQDHIRNIKKEAKKLGII